MITALALWALTQTQANDPVMPVQRVGFLYERCDTAQTGPHIESSWLAVKIGRPVKLAWTEAGRISRMAVGTSKPVVIDGEMVNGTLQVRRVCEIRPEMVQGPRANPVLRDALPAGVFAPKPVAESVQAGPVKLASVSENRKYLNLVVTFSDARTQRPHAADWYTRVMRGTYPGLDHFYQTVSQNRINMTGTQVIGFLDLPGTMAEYKSGNAWDIQKLIDGAMPLVDSQVDFRKIWGVNVFPNIDDNSGYSYATWARIKSAETDWYRPVTSLNPWTDQFVLVHEEGHNFDLDHTSVAGAVYKSNWDPMGNGGRYWSNTFEDYGMIGTVFNGYHHTVNGWLKQEEIATVTPGQNVSIKLSQLENASSTDTRLARVFLPGSGSVYYTVEARKNAVYDTAKSIASEAVIIHKVTVANAWNSGASVLLARDPADTSGGAGCAWRVGETFTDAENNLSITVTSGFATGFNVQVNYGAGTPCGVASNTADSGPGSLREAIAFANLNPGTKIRFNIRKTDPGFSGGVFRIAPKSPLPIITADNVQLLGATQTSFTGNSNPKGPEVYLDFSGQGDGHGINIQGKSALINGLAMGGSKYSSVWLDGTASTTVAANFIGLSADGTTAAANGWDNVTLVNGATSCTIGGSVAAYRNVLAGSNHGVYVDGPTTAKNKILGNLIGLNGDGTGVLGNRYNGVRLNNSTNGNSVGPGNVIAGNGNDGVLIWDSASYNTVAGNSIGFLLDGTTVKGNGVGVGIGNKATKNMVGGTTAASANIIVGSTNGGVQIVNEASANTVIGNFIGCTPKTSILTGNKWVGVAVYAKARNNVVQSNVISGNTQAGVYVGGKSDVAGQLGTSGNQIKYNRIGTDPDGTVAWANGGQGIVVVDGAAANRIEANLISGNQSDGIGVGDLGTNKNVFVDNNLGVNAAGTAAIANKGAGVWLGNGASSNLFQRNRICASPWDGIYVYRSDSVNNQFFGNTIGSLDASLSNRNGMMFDRTGRNTVGGTAAGQANTIIGNRSNGILVTGTATGVAIRGNVISRNGKIAINLDGSNGNFGVTPNDPLDADTGPNGLTNFPTITLVGEGESVKATVSLSAAPSRDYAVDLFGVLAPDVSGNGGADVFLGTYNVTTNASGKASLYKTVGTTGQYSSISATATEVRTQSTSELGPNTVGVPIPRISVAATTGELQVTIEAKLRDRATDQGIANAEVGIYVDGVLKKWTTTSANGTSSITVPIPGLAVGNHTVWARYRATTKYGANIATGTFTIK